MEYIQFSFGILIILIIITAIVKVYMKFANHIGEVFGIGKFFMKVYEKIKNKLT